MTADRMANKAAPRATRNAADAEQLYRELKFIRRVEETIAVIYPTDKIKSPVHLSIGQESIAVGICSALRPDDVVAGTYRGHALFLAKGGDLDAMMAELYGKATGCSGGKGGSMHLVGFEQGILGTSAIVGSTIPIAVGYAMALKCEGKGRVVTVFMGDGATEEGVFYESVNFAALHKLPIVFVCENNGYAIYTALNKRWSSSAICDRVKGFGVPVERFETGDVFEIRDALRARLDSIRYDHAGPLFFECLTYRWLEHVGPQEDYNLGHRSRDEATFWLENDQVMLTGAMIDPAQRAIIDAEIEKRIARAVEFAETSPLPADEDLYANVFAP